ncbi:MAG: type II toxin-antitoxin system HicB family antitoxin [Pseudomonadota bacterium]
MARYLGLVDGAGSTWGVRIPDFPGCHGGGATPGEAMADATRALREFAADMVADGEAIPVPRDYNEIKADLEAQGEPWGGAVYIPLLLDQKRLVRANISLDAGLLAAIDEAAAERGLTRSAFLVSAALDKIADAK